MEFSERLRLLRTQAQMTQEELAAKLFVTRQAVSNYEQGIRYPSLDTLVRIAQLFGVSLDELLSTSVKRRYVSGVASRSPYCSWSAALSPPRAAMPRRSGRSRHRRCSSSDRCSCPVSFR